MFESISTAYTDKKNTEKISVKVTTSTNGEDGTGKQNAEKISLEVNTTNNGEDGTKQNAEKITLKMNTSDDVNVGRTMKKIPLSNSNSNSHRPRTAAFMYASQNFVPQKQPQTSFGLQGLPSPMRPQNVFEPGENDEYTKTFDDNELEDEEEVEGNKKSYGWKTMFCCCQMTLFLLLFTFCMIDKNLRGVIFQDTFCVIEDTSETLETMTDIENVESDENVFDTLQSELKTEEKLAEEATEMMNLARQEKDQAEAEYISRKSQIGTAEAKADLENYVETKKGNAESRLDIEKESQGYFKDFVNDAENSQPDHSESNIRKMFYQKRKKYLENLGNAVDARVEVAQQNVDFLESKAESDEKAFECIIKSEEVARSKEKLGSVTASLKRSRSNVTQLEISAQNLLTASHKAAASEALASKSGDKIQVAKAAAMAKKAHRDSEAADDALEMAKDEESGFEVAHGSAKRGYAAAVAQDHACKTAAAALKSRTETANRNLQGGVNNLISLEKQVTVYNRLDDIKNIIRNVHDTMSPSTLDTLKENHYQIRRIEEKYDTLKDDLTNCFADSGDRNNLIDINIKCCPPQPNEDSDKLGIAKAKNFMGFLKAYLSKSEKNLASMKAETAPAAGATGNVTKTWFSGYWCDRSSSFACATPPANLTLENLIAINNQDDTDSSYSTNMKSFEEHFLTQMEEADECISMKTKKLKELKKLMEEGDLLYRTWIQNIDNAFTTEFEQNVNDIVYIVSEIQKEILAELKMTRKRHQLNEMEIITTLNGAKMVVPPKFAEATKSIVLANSAEFVKRVKETSFERAERLENDTTSKFESKKSEVEALKKSKPCLFQTIPCN